MCILAVLDNNQVFVCVFSRRLWNALELGDDTFLFMLNILCAWFEVVF